MRGKRYLAVTVLSWLVIIVLGWYFVYDLPRMDRAEVAQKVEAAAIGAVIYAENCVVCHGPVGEGVVGPPLQTEAFRADPAENKEVYDMIYRAIAHGRPGTSDPHWVRLPTGQWASYTAMPAWSEEAGGPMNEQQIYALTHFIMMGDWSSVGRHIPPPTPWVDSETGEILWDRMPTPSTITEEEAQRGKEIFVNKACASCHTLGAVGGNVGPDLTKVGAWGLDEEFLKEWIRNPLEVVERAPRYWSNYGGPYQFPIHVGQVDQPGQVSQIGMTTEEGVESGARIGLTEMQGGGVGFDFPIPDTAELPPTQMPPLGLTDQEIDDLVHYLMHLK